MPIGLPRCAAAFNVVLDGSLKLPGWGKPGAVSILSAIFKRRGADVSIQSALFEHYVGGSAQPFDLNALEPIPERWQLWIVRNTGAKPGTYSQINGENAQLAGLDDLSDSLGHFTVLVKQKRDSKTMSYEIRKEGKEEYQFGFSPYDRRRIHRHGFDCHLPTLT